MNRRKQDRKDSFSSLLFPLVVLVVVAIALFVRAMVVDAKGELQNPSGSDCSKSLSSSYGTVLGYAWFSSTKTGDWKTDSLFYKLNGYEKVVVLKHDGGYYLVCWDFGSDYGYDAIVGWVQKNRILLDSEVNPTP